MWGGRDFVRWGVALRTAVGRRTPDIEQAKVRDSVADAQLVRTPILPRVTHSGLSSDCTRRALGFQRLGTLLRCTQSLDFHVHEPSGVFGVRMTVVVCCLQHVISRFLHLQFGGI
jgi:hypothetical protein